MNRLAVICLGMLAAAATQAQEHLSDNEIKQGLENEFYMQPYINSDEVHVAASNGVVTLSGTVKTLMEKDKAEDIAGMVKGVRSIVNELKIEPSYLTDWQVKDAVRRALIVNPATESYKLGIEVRDGNVQLVGTVGSHAEQELATQVVKSVRGVKSVTNATEYAFSDDRDDEDIQEDILGLLQNDLRIDADDIDVDSDQGNVKVKGTVNTPYEEQLVMSHVWVDGVKSVDNSALEVRGVQGDTLMRNENSISRDDGEIKTAVKTALKYDARLRTFDANVKVHDGVVTLSGTAPSLAAKNATEEDARNIIGVTGVENEIEVEPTVQRSEEEIKKDIESAIASNALLSDSRVTVKVDKGLVTLHGKVRNNYLRAVTESVAAGVAGVTDVNNEITAEEPGGYYSSTKVHGVEPTGWREHYANAKSDETIALDIRKQLKWSPFVDASHIEVVVENGVATLAGNVDSLREERAAIENAYEGGAIDVVNELRL